MEHIASCGIFFCLGYIIGNLHRIIGLLGGRPEASESFVSRVLNEQRRSQRKVSIDDSKYVTDVSTDGLEASGAEIGITSTAVDDIAAASNKLAKLKKMKG